jgi:hypothetical protein
VTLYSSVHIFCFRLPLQRGTGHLYLSVYIVRSVPEDGIKQALCYPAHSDSIMKTELTASFLYEVSRIILLSNNT